MLYDISNNYSKNVEDFTSNINSNSLDTSAFTLLVGCQEEHPAYIE